jgi:hypothetical protein
MHIIFVGSEQSNKSKHQLPEGVADTQTVPKLPLPRRSNNVYCSPLILKVSFSSQILSVERSCIASKANKTSETRALLLSSVVSTYWSDVWHISYPYPRLRVRESEQRCRISVDKDARMLK